MGARSEEIDLEETSPFRAAFTQARLEGRLAGEVIVASHVSSDRRHERTTAQMRPVVPTSAAAGFEVWIEKRHGKKSKDASRWNELGNDGWELVAVVGKQAFFRRDRRRPGEARSPAAATFAP